MTSLGPAGARGSASRASLVPVTIARSLLLFVLAAVAEIGGAWLVWQGIRENRGLLWIGAGFIALAVTNPSLGLGAVGGIPLQGACADR